MELIKRLAMLFICMGASALAQDTTTAQWMALDARDGTPLSDIRFLVDGDTVIADSVGFAETRHPRTAQVLIVKLLRDSLELARDTFSIDTTQQFTSFVLEVLPRRYMANQTAQTSTPSPDMLVVARRTPLHERKEASRIELSRTEMREVAAIQNDPIQVLRTEPGVANQNDFNQRPHVRGGDWYETRVFWNGAPVVQPFHATSMFSIFNLEATEDMTFYSGGFPVEGSNSLSGALFLRARPAPTDSFGLWTNISMEKGHMWTGIPVVKDKFGVYFAYQAYWYDWVIKRILDVTDWFNDDPEYEQSVEEYKEYVDMPNFKDLQTGFSWNINTRLRLDYHYLRGTDLMRIIEPVRKEDELFGSKRKLDTIALVEVPNQIHGLNLRYAASERWDMQFSSTLQMVDWIVQFGNALDNNPGFDYDRYNAHARWQNYFRAHPHHLLDFGLSLEKDRSRYDVDMPRFAYELMMQSNMDMMENLGYLGADGFDIVSGDTEEDWESLMSNLMMDYAGTRSRLTTGAWFSDQWTLNSDNRLTLGTRLDWEDVSGDIFLSPRVSWFHRVNTQHELTFSAGLYHQDNFEFYYRHLNPNLASEKSAHLNAEWSYDITPDYRLEVMNYGKYYFDMASPRLVHSIDRDKLSSFLSTTQKNLENLSEQELRSMLGETLYAELLEYAPISTLSYDNSGIGVALGSEVRLHYDPTRIWRGWISGETSLSKRRDTVGGTWYNFRRHRPWAIKWHNYFDMPGDWEFSVRYTYTGGMVYTGYHDYSYRYEDNEAQLGDTLFTIERKNNRRYSPYARLDFRLERNHTLFGHPAVTYFEVWNALNTPNFLLTDSETGKLKFYDASYPLPIFYSGIEWRW